MNARKTLRSVIQKLTDFELGGLIQTHIEVAKVYLSTSGEADVSRLLEFGLISQKDLQRKIAKIRKSLAVSRKKQMKDLLKRLLKERERRQRQMLDKPIGPVQ